MQEQGHKKSGAFRLILSILLLSLAVALFLNRQYVFDTVMTWQYRPSAEIQELVVDSKMTDEAKFYFYASRPLINNRSEFNQNCTSSGEQTVVLGCYVSQRIYIFDVDDPRLDGIKEVTAAHEMLHAAYDRMSRGEKTRINDLLEIQLKSVTDERIRQLIAIYDKTEPGERLNELHSIFATELNELSPELEEYYSQYFSDRSAIVALSQQYEEVFTSLKAEQQVLIAELDSLAAKISSDSDAYNQATEQFNDDVKSFNDRASNGGYQTQAAFEADRNKLLERQNSLAAMRDEISKNIALYDEKVKALEAINGQAEQLNQSINSNALEPAPSI